jgi:hypothetical protein
MTDQQDLCCRHERRDDRGIVGGVFRRPITLIVGFPLVYQMMVEVMRIGGFYRLLFWCLAAAKVLEYLRDVMVYDDDHALLPRLLRCLSCSVARLKEFSQLRHIVHVKLTRMRPLKVPHLDNPATQEPQLACVREVRAFVARPTCEQRCSYTIADPPHSMSMRLFLALYHREW